MLCEEQCVFHLLASCVAMMLPIMLVLEAYPLSNVAITFMQQGQRVSILGEATLLQLVVEFDFSGKPSL